MRILLGSTVVLLLTACPPPQQQCVAAETCTCADGTTSTALCEGGVLSACDCGGGGEGEGEGVEGEGEEGEGEPLPCFDEDGDGFYTCADPLFPDRPTTVDCDDTRRTVVPGGEEFPDNERDDDCDDAVDEVEPPCECNGDDVLSGIGLCGVDVIASDTEGLASQRGVFADYFSLSGRSGDACFSALSSGAVDVPSHLRFDPLVQGLADLDVQTGPSESVSAVRCSFDGAEIDPCPRRFDLAIFNNGPRHVVEVAAVDVAGNVEALPLRLVFGGDPEPPPVVDFAIVSPLTATATSENKPSVVGTAPPGAKVDLTVDGVALAAAAPGLTSSTEADAQGRWVYPSEKMRLLGPGDHTIRASFTDDVTGGAAEVEVVVDVDPLAGDTTPPATMALVVDGIPDFEDVNTELFLDGFDESTNAAVNDPSSVTVEVKVPANALGFEVDVMFLSVEWPEFLCDQFNDAFRLIVESEALEGGEPTDIAFDRVGARITVNSGFFELPARWTTDVSTIPHVADLGPGGQCSEPLIPNCETPDYCDDGSNVGFQGSGTGWLKMRSPVLPGETMRLTFLIFDAGDFALDSIAFIDGFRWLSFTPPVGAVKDE